MMRKPLIVICCAVLWNLLAAESDACRCRKRQRCCCACQCAPVACCPTPPSQPGQFAPEPVEKELNDLEGLVEKITKPLDPPPDIPADIEEFVS